MKESVVSLGGRDVRTAVVYGTRAAEQLIATGAVDDYDFVEVMTCPGGCIGGGGQPDNGILPVPDQLRMARIRSLYLADQERSFRNSLENQEIKHLYETFIGEPMSKMAQLLLHTSYHSRKRGI